MHTKGSGRRPRLSGPCQDQVGPLCGGWDGVRRARPPPARGKWLNGWPCPLCPGASPLGAWTHQPLAEGGGSEDSEALGSPALLLLCCVGPGKTHLYEPASLPGKRWVMRDLSAPRGRGSELTVSVPVAGRGSRWPATAACVCVGDGTVPLPSTDPNPARGVRCGHLLPGPPIPFKAR